MADGNPRLLEWLNDEVLLGEDAETKLAQFEANPTEWQGRIIWEELYEQIDQDIERILSRCLVFEIPVPMTALSVVSGCNSEDKKQLIRAIELGLIEVSPEPKESNRIYRVSRIIPHIIPNIRLPEAPQIYSLYQKAHEKLHQLWGNKKNTSEEEWQEIFRLKFANKNNPEQFRQGFSQMLAVQFNSEADKAFESELRKFIDDLVKDGLCEALENYLNQKQWKEADEETAWIFYQVMVKENYRDWRDLLRNFPCETLKEINQLWLENSNNKFGISIQKSNIHHSLGGTSMYTETILEKLCERVGWKNERGWMTYSEVINDAIKRSTTVATVQRRELLPATLPLLIYTRMNGGWIKVEGSFEWGLVLGVLQGSSDFLEFE
ncbi:GUN4 domain-containing protein [Nostoc sp. NMS7]|uniref:GUN4 domain-containing protein n=1 Tax=Nostoc sp. NMS7 TaxID=2815391 RepID=UPI0025DA9A3B|nr:GUN4 domain-containing protein [Nostoc sp. NMS7]